jgi:hypothetical protein
MNFQSQVNIWRDLYNDTNDIELLYKIHNEIKQLKNKYYKIIKCFNKEIPANYEYLCRLKTLSKLLIEIRKKYELIANDKEFLYKNNLNCSYLDDDFNCEYQGINLNTEGCQNICKDCKFN